jgi:hypothetical protein
MCVSRHGNCRRAITTGSQRLDAARRLQQCQTHGGSRTEIDDFGYSSFRQARAAVRATARALLVACGFDDLDEAAWIEACATDKSAVNIGLAH